MVQDPLQVLHAAMRPQAAAGRPRLLIAGAGGPLGSEAIAQLTASGDYAATQVLACEPMRTGLRGVQALLVPPGDPADWPPPAAGLADVAVVLFDAPRLFNERERALWMPAPGQLSALARWLQAGGVRTLAVVLPHAPGRLPEALKRGLATLDEHAVAALGFERLLILRSAQRPAAVVHANPGARLAHWMLSIFGYMVPGAEEPVRPAKVAELLAAALRMAPAGIHVAAPEVVWRAAQGGADAVARQWLD